MEDSMTVAIDNQGPEGFYLACEREGCGWTDYLRPGTREIAETAATIARDHEYTVHDALSFDPSVYRDQVEQKLAEFDSALEARSWLVSRMPDANHEQRDILEEIDSEMFDVTLEGGTRFREEATI